VLKHISSCAPDCCLPACLCLPCSWAVFGDRCPHRLAPLSEGRLEPSTGQLMCSYHGAGSEQLAEVNKGEIARRKTGRQLLHIGLHVGMSHSVTIPTATAMMLLTKMCCCCLLHLFCVHRLAVQRAGQLHVHPPDRRASSTRSGMQQQAHLRHCLPCRVRRQQQQQQQQQQQPDPL
jgi:hypothetical protein